MIRSTVITICLFALLSCHETEDSREFLRKVNPIMDEYLSAHTFNGKFNGSLLVSSGDSIIHFNTYGFADRDSKAPIDDSTKFLIGSITKTFTAMGILLLEKAGKFTLASKLSNYFAEFPKSDNVTIHQLLTHTSGIRDYHYFQSWVELSKSELTTMDVINQVTTDPYGFKPASNFRYSNTGYIFLGLIIEQLSGKSFSEYIQEAILDPLALKNTGIITNEITPSGLAKGYTTTPKHTADAQYINYNQPFSSGNMYSTAWDLQCFTKAVINSELLPKAKTKEIFENNGGYYGYGWGLRDFDGTKGYGHHGGMNGFWGSITYLTESQTFMCFLTNDDNTPKYTINRDLVKILKGEKVKQPMAFEYRAMSDSTLSHCSSDYLIKPGDTLHVTTDGSGLFMQETGQLNYELFQVGDNRFVMTMQEFDVQFESDSLYFEGIVNLSAAKLN